MSGLDTIEAPDQKQTTVEEGTQFKGTLESTCPVVVRGVVNGDLHAPSVVVSETGSVTGSVKAQSLRSSGELAGHIEVDEVVLSGRVRNDTVIRAKTLEVKLQQTDDSKLEVKFGECILEIGDDPALELGEPSAQRASTNKKGNGGRQKEPSPAVEAAAAAAADKAVEASAKQETSATS